MKPVSSITNITCKMLFLLLILTPILPILGFVVPIPGIGSIKEIIAIIIIMISIIVLCTMGKLSFDLQELVIIAFCMYYICNLLFSEADIVNKINSGRYQILYLMLVYIFFKLVKETKINSRWIISRIIAIIYTTGLFVALVGVYESLVPGSIKSIYGESHLHVSYLNNEGIRLISTMKNPINLGYFMALCLIMAFFYMNYSESTLLRVVNIISVILFS